MDDIHAMDKDMAKLDMEGAQDGLYVDVVKNGNRPDSPRTDSQQRNYIGNGSFGGTFHQQRQSSTTGEKDRY